MAVLWVILHLVLVLSDGIALEEGGNDDGGNREGRWWYTTQMTTDYTNDATTWGQTNISCNFDSGDCGYSKQSSSLQWIRHSGSTPSSSTGPSGDHTTGHGHYMYIETSTGQPGDVARLVSPTIYDYRPYCLQFAYHMYGTDINQLRVLVGSSVVWSQSNNKGNSWHIASVEVYIGNTQVVFEGVRGGGYRGDIAIDDIALYPGSCAWTDDPFAYNTYEPTTAPDLTTDSWWWTTAWNNWWTTANTDYYHNFQVRLRGGDYYSYGRVEVYYSGQWGTVCDDGFGWNEANVVCHELGFDQVDSYYYNAHYGQGSGPIWMDDLNCYGSESSLQYCSHRGWGSSNCGHGNDVSVSCMGPTTTDTPWWWATTDRPWWRATTDWWNGWTTEATATAPDYWRWTTDWKWWQTTPEPSTDVETTTEDPTPGWWELTTPYWNWWETTPGNIRIRLVNGDGYSYGRVEVHYNGQWGTVCDDNFGWQEARVVCRELGFSNFYTYHYSAYFGQGSGPIWMDDLSCSGSESSLGHCSHRGWGNNNCGHNEDIGVVCGWHATSPEPYTGRQTDNYWRTEEPTTAPDSWWTTSWNNWWTAGNTDSYYNFQVRLRGGDNYSYGRVEVFYNGQWGTVCDDNFGWQEARVVCRELGFYDYHNYYYNAFYGSGSGQIWMDDVSCSGSESSLQYCRHNGWGSHNCGHGNDVSVSCMEATTTEKPWWWTTMGWWNTGGATDYINTTDVDPCSNYIVLNEAWRSTENNISNPHCDDGFNGEWYRFMEPAGTAMPTYPPPSTHRCGTHAPMWMSGTHPTVGDGEVSRRVCAFWSSSTCHWSITVQVKTCSAGYYVYKLPRRHRWCYAAYCGVSEEFNSTGITEEPTTAPDSWWTTAWNNWWTPGNTDPYYNFQIRLRGGDGYSYGRVEVYYSGQWGTVCDDSFDYRDARVICRELGFSDYVTYHRNAHYGQGSGPIWMDDLNCYGSESSLQYCPRNGWGNHDCEHGEDVSVVCGGANGTDLPTVIPPWHTSKPDLGMTGSCDSDMMTVTFDLWVAPWLDGNLMHFADPTCKAVNNGSHLILATKLNDCGTSRNETDDYVIYTNKVLMYSSNHSVIIRDLQLEVPVTCKLPRKSVVSAQFTADSNAVRYNLEREGKFDIALQFYGSSSFYYAYNGPVGLQLNEMAYAQARLNSDDDLRIRVDSCVATPSQNPADTVIYSVIENNCPKDPTVMTYYTPSPKVERFGFRAFQFTTGQNKVYLHCLVQVCDGSDPNSRCTQGCMRRDAREKREATPSNQLRQVSAGPIFLRMPGDDEGVDFSAEKKTFASGNFAQTPALTIAIAAVAGLAVVVLGVAAMAFVYKHRRDKMAFRYQPVDTTDTY